jgi:peroxiredoxin
VLAAAILTVAAPGSATGDPPELGPLLTPLDLVGYWPGTRPPPFAGLTADARPLSMPLLRGNVVVVNFWASWCAECRPEMPMFERLHRDFGPRGFMVIGVNARERPDTVQRYARELGLTFPLLLDPDGSINQAYGVIGLPATFVIARDGRAVAFAVGPRAWTSPAAQALIERLLAEPAPRAP